MTNQYPSREANRRRVEDIRSRYSDLVAFVEQDYMTHVRRSGNGFWFPCWAHHDKTPSLKVSDRGFKCFSASCQHGGSDVIDWVGWRNNLDPKNTDDFFKILDKIDGGTYTPLDAPKYAQVKIKRRKKRATLAKVLRDHRQFDKAMSYFSGRAITDTVGRQFYLGARIPFALPYRTLDGKEYWMEHNRYAIPNVRGDVWNHGDVLEIALRYDDTEMRHTLAMFACENEDLYTRLLEDIDARYSRAGQAIDLSDSKIVIQELYGKKYHNLTNKVGVWNAGYLVDFEKQQRLDRSLAFAVEGQIDMISGISAGYPMLACPQSKQINYGWLFEKVDHVVIIADNDEHGQGIDRARWLQERIGKRKSRIILPEHGKDVNDECRMGTIHKWMGQHSFSPTLSVA